MNFNASKHEYLIATHVSMLAIATRSLVLRKSHGEILRILSAGQQRMDILSGISETEWMRIFLVELVRPSGCGKVLKRKISWR